MQALLITRLLVYATDAAREHYNSCDDALRVLSSGLCAGRDGGVCEAAE